MGPDTEKKGLEPVFAQLVDGDVFSEFDTCLELNPEILDDLNFTFDTIAWKTVGRNTDGQHAAQYGQFFKDRDLVSFYGQEIGTGQAGRTCSDNCYLFRSFCFLLRYKRSLRFKIPVCQKTVQILNGQRLVHLVSGTGSFTGVMAHPAADTGKGMILLEQFQGLQIFSCLDQGDESLDANMRRTGYLAGSRTSFFYGKSARNGLGVLFEGSSFLYKVFIIVVGQGYRTDLCAFTTAGAFIDVDVPGRLTDVCG